MCKVGCEQELTKSEVQIVKTKELRGKLDNILQEIKELEFTRETALSITKVQEAIMWLGMNLKRLGNPDPYPGTKDAATGTLVYPTADGLKL